jgi:excisionase family DNA binding protein
VNVDDRLPLQQAADELGVHYQTAYRWVRSGRLPAHLVAGKYVVLRRDLDAVDARRRTPSSPTAPSSRRLDRQAERMHAALIDGDEATAQRIARRLSDEGTSAVELIERIFVPSLRRIGRAWHDGQLSIWTEHRASAIVERLLGELAPNPRGRRRGDAMVAAVAGDHHSLPTTMAAIALREANWRVHHLGADMPGEELVRFCAAQHVDVAVISLTNPAVAELADETADRIRAAGTPAIVGGPGRSLTDLVDLTRSSSAIAAT